MRFIGLLLGCCLIPLQLASSAQGAFISLADLSKEASADSALGITITPTGPTSLPFVQGGLEVLGASSPIDNDVQDARIYSGKATFANPIKSVTLQVARANNSGWSNPITLTAFDDGKEVKSTTVDLPPPGEWTAVSLSAASIDKIQWGGAGWVFQPYFINSLQVTFAASASVTSPRGTSASGGTPSVSSPDVSSPAPEPGTVGMLAIAGTAMLLRRTRPTPKSAHSFQQ